MHFAALSGLGKDFPTLRYWYVNTWGIEVTKIWRSHPKMQRCLRGIRDFVTLEGQGSIENVPYPKSAHPNTFLEVASTWRQGRAQVFGTLGHLIKGHFKP